MANGDTDLKGKEVCIGVNQFTSSKIDNRYATLASGCGTAFTSAKLYHSALLGHDDARKQLFGPMHTDM